MFHYIDYLFGILSNSEKNLDAYAIFKPYFVIKVNLLISPVAGNFAVSCAD